MPVCAELEVDLLAIGQLGYVERGVLMDAERFTAAIGACQHLPLTSAARFRKRLLRVRGFEVLRGRLDPDLQQVDALGLRVVHFAVLDSATSGHGLELTGAELAVAARTIAMAERAFE